METRRQFDAEFKKEAVRLIAESGKSAAEIAKDLGINPTQLYYWKRISAAKR